MEILENSMHQRTALLVGSEGIEKLSQKTVAVFGCGGVGGTALEILARTGIGKLIIVDFDTFDITNLNRQILCNRENVGNVKIEEAVKRLKNINPGIEIVTHPIFFDESQWDCVFSEKVDYVIDAIDSVPAKFYLIKRCYELRIPLIASMGAGNKLDPSKVSVTDISKTSHCGLAKTIRKKLKEAGITRGVTVVFSSEPPVQLPHIMTSPDDQRRKKKLIGSISYMPSLFGLQAAAHVIKQLLKK